MQWFLRRVAVFPFLSLVLTVLVFAILVLFDRGLLDPPGVFVGVMSVWVLPWDFLL